MSISMQRQSQAGHADADLPDADLPEFDDADVGGAELGAPKIHSHVDVEHAVRALGRADALRLRAAATTLVRGFHIDRAQRDHDDLLSEAISRLLSGERSWRRGVDFVHQVIQIMRSIASDWRRRVVLRSEKGASEQREADLPWTQADADGPVLRAPAPESTPEASLIAASEVASIKWHFAPDREASAVIVGLEKGMSPAEIQRQTGMSKRQWLTAMQRIRRNVRRWRSRDE